MSPTARGVVGQAFTFNGDGSILVNSTFPFHSPDDATLVFWLLYHPPGGAETGLFWTRSDLADANRFNIFMSNDENRFLVDYRSPGGDMHLHFGPVIPADVWMHLAVTRAGDTYTIYTNGQFAAAMTDASPDLPDAAGWMMSGWANGNRLVGELDEVMLFNHALAADEIADIYAAGAAGMCRTLQVLVPPQNATAYVGVSNALMSVVADGAGLLTYQWQHGGTSVPGQTGATFVLASPALADAGDYTVVVTDANGSITSQPPAALSIGSWQCAPAGLVAWWPGDGSPLDVSTNHFDGTLVGGASYAPGMVNQAFSFDGSSGYLRVNGSRSMSGPRTIEGWIYPGPNPGLGGPLVTMGWSGYGDFWGIAGSDQGLLPNELYIDHWGTPCFRSYQSVPEGAWSHVALVFDGGSVTCYLNGQSSGPTGCCLYDVDLDTFILGGNTIGGSTTKPYFNGLMDEFAVYDRALSAAEVQAIYAAGSQGKRAPLVLAQPQGLDCGWGDSALFSVIASGAPPLTYQWRKDGTEVGGKTDATLLFTRVQLSDAAGYDVVVANAYGATTSQVAVLRVDSCANAPDGLVAWWSGDGHALDLGANHNNGKLVGEAGYGSGKVGPAFAFDGNGFVSIPDSPSLQLPDAPFSIALWFQTDDPTRNQVLLSKGLADANEEYTLNLRPDGSIYWDYGGTTAYITSAAGAVSSTQWYYLVAMYDPASSPPGAVYLNGAAQNVVASGSGAHIVSSGSNLYLGSQNAGSPYYSGRVSFLGQIDEVAIFNRALSTNEIASLYTADAAGICKPLQILSTPQSATAYVGVSNGLMSVVADGTGLVTYQWQRGGTDVPGQTNATFALASPASADAGDYTVIVTDASGSITNPVPAATLAVKPCEDSVADGLVGWWSGDGHADDLTTNQNNGVLEPGSTYGSGLVGQAFSFNGTQGGVWIPPSPSLDVGAGDGFTFVAWVFRTDVIPGRSDWWAPIFEYFDGVHFWQDANPNGLYLNVVDSGGGTHSFYADGVLTPGAWNQVAFSYSKTTGQATVYANGAPTTSVNVGSYTPQTSTALSLGSRAAGSFADARYTYNGLIDEATLYNRALSDAEVAALFAARQDGMCKALQILGLPQNPVAYVGVSNVLAVAASGAGALTYQWSWNGTDLEGQTNAALLLPNPQLTNAGIYAVVVGDTSGQFVTNSTTLDVQPCVAVPSGLAGWWPGDGHLFDLASTNHGRAVNEVSYGPGVVGQALVLDGDRQFVRLGNPPELHFQTFTLAAWVKRVSASQISRYTPQGPGGLILGYGQSGYNLLLSDDGSPGLSKIGVGGVGPLAWIFHKAFDF